MKVKKKQLFYSSLPNAKDKKKLLAQEGRRMEGFKLKSLDEDYFDQFSNTQAYANKPQTAQTAGQPDTNKIGQRPITGEMPGMKQPQQQQLPTNLYHNNPVSPILMGLAAVDAAIPQGNIQKQNVVQPFPEVYNPYPYGVGSRSFQAGGNIQVLQDSKRFSPYLSGNTEEDIKRNRKYGIDKGYLTPDGRSFKVPKGSTWQDVQDKFRKDWSNYSSGLDTFYIHPTGTVNVNNMPNSESLFGYPGDKGTIKVLRKDLPGNHVKMYTGGQLMSTDRDYPIIIPEGMGDNTPMAKDGHWIQKAVNPKHKGYCTPMTKSTCTPRRKALAKTFKKMAKRRKGDDGLHLEEALMDHLMQDGGIIPDNMSVFNPHMYADGGVASGGGGTDFLEQWIPWMTGEYQQGGAVNRDVRKDHAQFESGRANLENALTNYNNYLSTMANRQGSPVDMKALDKLKHTTDSLANVTKIPVHFSAGTQYAQYPHLKMARGGTARGGSDTTFLLEQWIPWMTGEYQQGGLVPKPGPQYRFYDNTMDSSDFWGHLHNRQDSLAYKDAYNKALQLGADKFKSQYTDPLAAKFADVTGMPKQYIDALDRDFTNMNRAGQDAFRDVERFGPNVGNTPPTTLYLPPDTQKPKGKKKAKVGSSIRGGSDTTDLLEQWIPWLTGEYRSGGQLSASKAKEMLRDGTAQGHPLTERQKRYFGWIAGGAKAQAGTEISHNPMDYANVNTPIGGANVRQMTQGVLTSKNDQQHYPDSSGAAMALNYRDAANAYLTTGKLDKSLTSNKDFVSHMSLFNQRPDVKNLTPEQKVQMFYQTAPDNPAARQQWNQIKGLPASQNREPVVIPQMLASHTLGGMVNSTGYLHGHSTADNDYNIIPGGNITMKGVKKKIIGRPIKKGKLGAEMLMHPGQDYQFDADAVLEYPAMQDGGTIGTMWGGKSTMASDNPYDGGTVKFEGASHEDGGIGIHYDGKPVEVEGNEYASKDSMGNLNIYGNMYLPGTRTKFKAVAGEIAKKEKRYDYLKTKGSKLVNASNPADKFSRLTFDSGRMMMMGGDLGQKDISEKKERLAALQKAMLDTADMHGIDAQEMSKGRIKKAKKGARIAQAGAVIVSGVTWGRDNGGDPVYQDPKTKRWYNMGTGPNPGLKADYNKIPWNAYVGVDADTQSNPRYPDEQGKGKTNKQVQTPPPPPSSSDANDPTIADRNNNPGNIKWSDFAKKMGATKDPNSGFAVFPNKEAGLNAMKSLLKSPTYSGMSVKDAINKWTGARPYRYDLGDIANKKVSDLTEDEFNNTINTMAKGEGTVYGAPVGKGNIQRALQTAVPLPTITPYGLPQVPGFTPDQQQPEPQKVIPPYDKLQIPDDAKPIPSNVEPLHLNQVLGELYAAGTNRQEPVVSQKYQPELYTPYQVSFQDRLNSNQSSFDAITRLVGANNPSALSAIAAQKYQADNAVKGDEFRTNQSIASDITNKNIALMNDAQLKNLGIADTQYTRQSQAKSKTKELNQMILNSLSSKFAQNEYENKRLAAYENLYDYRFVPQKGGGEKAMYYGPNAAFNFDGTGQNRGGGDYRTVSRYDQYGNAKGYTTYDESQLKTEKEAIDLELARRKVPLLTTPKLFNGGYLNVTW